MGTTTGKKVAEVAIGTRKGKRMKKETKAFGRYENGFTITFENGLVLSTRFGSMNYCENKSATLEDIDRSGSEPLVSNDAEVAVWRVPRGNTDQFSENGGRNWVTEWQQDIFQDSRDNDVRGWVQIANWLQLLEWCRDHPAEH